MSDGADQTLTSVQSPTASGQLPDVALFLMVGSADEPALPPSRRLFFVGEGLHLGRRAPDHSNDDQASAILNDTLVSGHHARIVGDAGRYELQDLGSKNGTWVDNIRVEGRAPLHDGALVFIGNHAGVFRLASTLEAEAIRSELTNPLGPVATASPALALACDRLRRLATSDSELFILGETGAGKEVYARAVHLASGRKGRFVAINCGAIPRELVESELFGYRQGAHSTAHQAKAGLIEEAEGGTLFLDEIGEMTGEAQIKLLRFLQDRELTPLGSTRPRRIDVRVIAATNRTLPGSGGKTAAGLRDDIVARLGAAPIHLPPLRSRIEDLGVLIAHFLRATPDVKLEQPAFRALCLHGWPLNVRELEKVVSTAAILTTAGKAIALRDLPEPIARAASAPAAAAAVVAAAAAAGAAGTAGIPRKAAGPSPTAAQLEELLKRYDGNVADVSRELGKHRAAVWRWLKKFGIGPQKYRKDAE
ncbi:MAG TPA: sigma 54-interacting transcriptional regulator [Polyangia bacterium]|nr:sigma 54-interacting transcriptional regulator [Polyangia bacterium]